ncbi:MAG: hypothetical protein QXX68_00500 [Candidatus Pacearchaeota archaeon]
MEKEIIVVSAASEILKLKKDFPEELDDDLIRKYLERSSFKNEKEKLNAIKAANYTLKIKSKEALTDKKIIQKVLETLK